MSRTLVKVLVPAALVVVLAVTASIASAGGAAKWAGAGGSPKAKTSNPQQLNGTWLTTITLQNPPPGLAPTFRALDTFVPGGGLIVSSSQGMPGLRSVAHGEWARIGNLRFTSTFVWFRFDAAGAFVGMQRVRRVMTVAPDLRSFQATDTIDVLAPDGVTVVATLQATESGQRLGAG